MGITKKQPAQETAGGNTEMAGWLTREMLNLNERQAAERYEKAKENFRAAAQEAEEAFANLARVKTLQAGAWRTCKGNRNGI